MSIYKRGAVWWITFSVKGAPRVRCSSGTSDKAAAQELHDKMKVESWEVAKNGAKPRHTFNEAAVRFLKERASKKSLANDAYKLNHYTGRKGIGERYLDELTSDVIRAAVEGYKAGVSTTTRNRHYALLRSILRLAATDWEWLDVAPHVRLYKESNSVVRWLKPEEAAALLVELPEHLKGMVEFDLATGLRMRNLTHLRWDKVDMGRRHAVIEGHTMKNGRPLAVPLNDSAISVLHRVQGRDPVWVFGHRGRPMGSPNGEAWVRALKRAGIENFRFHDLRHTWASWHVQNGTPLHELMEMGGWQSIQMVQRYAHLSSTQLTKAAARLDGILPRARMKLVVNK